MRYLFFVVLFLFFEWTVTAQSLEESVLLGIRLSEQGKTDEAIAAYDQAIRSYGDLAMLHVLKGEVYAGSSRRFTTDKKLYDLAVAEFNFALQLDSTFFPAYKSRGLLNIFHQHFDRAVSDLTRYLDFTTGDSDAQFSGYMDRGSAKLHLKDYEGAASDYATALRFGQGDANTYANLGQLYVQTGQNDKAEVAFLKGLEMDNKNIPVMNNLGLYYIRSGKLQAAIDVFNRALQIDPDEPYVNNNIGLALLKSKKAVEALKHINHSLKFYPENAYAYKHLGMAQLQLKQKDEACASWQRALDLGYEKTFDKEVSDLLNRNCRRKK
jgi:Flp pilus assembly protein TadD